MGDVLQFPGARRTVRTDGLAVDHGAAPKRPESKRPTPAGRATMAESSASPATASPRPLLWREAVGHELRDERHRQGRHLADVAQTAGISPQYLSEMERGRKEASSEILAAAAESLGLQLATLTTRASHTLGGTTAQLRAA